MQQPNLGVNKNLSMMWFRRNSVRLLVLLITKAIFSGSLLASKGALAGEFFPVSGQPQAQEIVLKDQFGDHHSLLDYRGRVVLVNFWATWCSPCLKELPGMQSLWEMFSEAPFQILAINVGETHSVIDDFLSTFETPIDFQILIDVKMDVVRKWQVRGVPTTYLVDQKGRLAEFAEGSLDFTDNSVVERITELMTEGG